MKDRTTEFSHPGIGRNTSDGGTATADKGRRPTYGNFRVTFHPTAQARYKSEPIDEFGISNPRSIILEQGDAAHQPRASPIRLGESVGIGTAVYLDIKLRHKPATSIRCPSSAGKACNVPWN